MVGSFLDVFFLLLAVILSELYGKLRRNTYWVTGKSAQKNLCEGHHFFDGTLSFLCHFLLLSSSTPLPKWRICWMAPIKIQNIATGGILCDVENMKFVCNLILAVGICKSAILFKTFFSFSCSGYDVTLIIKSHISNCYSFLLKFLKSKNLQTRFW